MLHMLVWSIVLLLLLLLLLLVLVKLTVLEFIIAREFSWRCRTDHVWLLVDVLMAVV